MKNSHSYLSPKCELRESSIHHKGLFAMAPFYTGELVLIWAGDLLLKKDVIPCYEPADNVLQIYDDIWLGFQGSDDQECDMVYKLNHSCEPNIGVKGQSIFIARRPIKANEELNFDYETTEMAYPGWVIQCNCGKETCRKVIDGNGWKDPVFRQRNKGFFSWYLQEKIDHEISPDFVSKSGLNRPIATGGHRGQI